MNLLELIKGTPTPTRPPGGLIELQNLSLRITLAGAIEISRLGLTPQPPMVNMVNPVNVENVLHMVKMVDVLLVSS